jgi:hypothetical protein
LLFMMRLSGSVKFFWAFASGSVAGGAAFGPGFRGIERHNAHEIDPFAAGLGDAPRGVDAAAVRIGAECLAHAAS